MRIIGAKKKVIDTHILIGTLDGRDMHGEGIDEDMLNPTGTGQATGLTPGDKYFQIGYELNGIYSFSVPSSFVGYYELSDYLQTLGLSDSMQLQNIVIRSLI